MDERNAQTSPHVEPRLPVLGSTECSETVAEIVRVAEERASGARNIFATLAHHPRLLRRLVPFAGKLLNDSAFSSDDRELVILRTAHRCGSRYEWIAHVRIGVAEGLSEADLNACAGDAAPAQWPARRRAIIAAVDELLEHHAISDSTWEDLATVLSTEQLIELPFLVGNYAMLAGFLNTFRVQPD